MKFFDVGGNATGFIAIGGQATGFFALGQMATGFIAIGQLARGVIAIGQLGVGLIGWGQGGVGILHAVGMLAVGGRGAGIVIPLVPSLGRARVLPPSVPFAAVHAGQTGWVSATLANDAQGLGLWAEGVRLPVKLDRRVLRKASELATDQGFPVSASIQKKGTTFVCDRLLYEPLRPYKTSSWRTLAAFQLAGFLVLGAVYWVVAGNALLAFTRKALDLDDARPTPAAVVPTAAPTAPPAPAPVPAPVRKSKLPGR